MSLIMKENSPKSEVNSKARCWLLSSDIKWLKPQVAKPSPRGPVQPDFWKLRLIGVAPAGVSDLDDNMLTGTPPSSLTHW